MILRIKYKPFWNLCLISFLVGFTNLAQGQGSARHSVCVVIPAFAVLDVEPSNTPITLQLQTPTEAGSALDADQVDGSKWLNYTSAISVGGNSRSITAQITSGSLPEGIRLTLQASNSAGGGGATGATTGIINLSNNPQTIISGIGRSYTGMGTGSGHQLIYGLSIVDYTKLDADANQNVQVIFTITE